MSYLCDIYEKITGACGFIFVFGCLVLFFCPAAPTAGVAKKMLCLAAFLVFTSGVALLFLPSKEFICGA